MTRTGKNAAPPSPLITRSRPDNVPHPSNISASASRAEQDAIALDQALDSKDGVSADGRTVDQILEEQAKHKDIPAYAASYVSTIGVDKYLDLPQRIAGYYTTVARDGNHIPPQYKQETDWDKANSGVSILGDMLAVVSQPDVTLRDKNGNTINLVDSVEKAAEAEGHLGRMSGLNALIENSNNSYGTDFLVGLATRFEDNGYDGSAADDHLGEDGYGGVYGDSSMDPMAGVLSGMGKNSEAALKYLVPDGAVDASGNWSAGPAAQKRWELLSSRTWDPQGGLDGFTAALGGAPAYRVYNPDGDKDERAAWITGKGIDYLGAQNVDYTSTSKDNIAIMLGNSLHDMENVTAERQAIGHKTTPYDNYRPASLTGDHSDAIRKLTGIVGSEDSSLQIISNAVGRQSTQRTQATIAAHPNAIFGSDEAFDNEIATGAYNDGLLLGYIEQSAIDARTNDKMDAAAKEAASNRVESAVVGGMGVGLSAIPTPWTQAAGIGISIATPFLDDTTQVDLSDSEKVQNLSDRTATRLERSTISQMANNGRLDEQAFYDVNNQDYSEGLPWMNSDHTIDTRMVLDDEDASQQFETWIQDNSIPSADYKGNLSTGMEIGRRNAQAN